MQRIGKGIQNGERWDKILLENGIVGYIYQAYVKEIPHVQIEKIDITIENTNPTKRRLKTITDKDISRTSS